MDKWDNKAETGNDSPVRVVITDGPALLADITGETPANALCTALCLLEATLVSELRTGPMVDAVIKASALLNDASILEAEAEAQRAKRYRLVLTDEQQRSEVEVWDFGPDTPTPAHVELDAAVDRHEAREYGG